MKLNDEDREELLMVAQVVGRVARGEHANTGQTPEAELAEDLQVLREAAQMLQRVGMTNQIQLTLTREEVGQLVELLDADVAMLGHADEEKALFTRIADEVAAQIGVRAADDPALAGQHVIPTQPNQYAPLD